MRHVTHKFDVESIIQLRNAFVKNSPDDKGFIAFLEQRAITLMFNFGKWAKYKLRSQELNRRPKLLKNTIKYASKVL